MKVGWKADLRGRVLELRSKLTPEVRAEKSRLICGQLIARMDNQGAGSSPKDTVFCFIPFGDEVDIAPFIEWCWSRELRVAASRTLPKTKELKLHVISAWEDLVSGVWGIREPRPECPGADSYGDIRWVVVPGVAFDERMGRLGYGGGYYDRFFAGMADRGLYPMKIAPVFECQVVEEVPTEEHDHRVDLILTEQRIINGIN